MHYHLEGGGEVRSLFDIAVVVTERPMMQRPRTWRQLRPTWLVKASFDLELSATFRDNFLRVTLRHIQHVSSIPDYSSNYLRGCNWYRRVRSLRAEAGQGCQ